MIECIERDCCNSTNESGRKCIIVCFIVLVWPRDAAESLEERLLMRQWLSQAPAPSLREGRGDDLWQEGVSLSLGRDEEGEPNSQRIEAPVAIPRPATPPSSHLPSGSSRSPWAFDSFNDVSRYLALSSPIALSSPTQASVHTPTLAPVRSPPTTAASSTR